MRVDHQPHSELLIRGSQVRLLPGAPTNRRRSAAPCQWSSGGARTAVSLSRHASPSSRVIADRSSTLTAWRLAHRIASRDAARQARRKHGLRPWVLPHPAGPRRTRRMSDIGRNDPCPCGSGKKYKRCCLAKDAPAPGAWTTGERDSALASLMRFARRAELDGDRAAAEVAFWGKRLERMTPAEARETMDFEQSRFGFHEWLGF